MRSHLVGDRLDDLRVIDPGAEDAVPAQAVDVFPAQEIPEYGALARPFQRRELSGLGDRLAVANEPAVDVLLVGLHRLGDEGLLLLQRHLLAANEPEVALALLQDFTLGQPHSILPAMRS